MLECAPSTVVPSRSPSLVQPSASSILRCPTASPDRLLSPAHYSPSSRPSSVAVATLPASLVWPFTILSHLCLPIPVIPLHLRGILCLRHAQMTGLLGIILVPVHLLLLVLLILRKASKRLHRCLVAPLAALLLCLPAVLLVTTPIHQ